MLFESVYTHSSNSSYSEDGKSAKVWAWCWRFT